MNCLKKIWGTGAAIGAVERLLLWPTGNPSWITFLLFCIAVVSIVTSLVTADRV